jgi:hypothetical protein
MAKGSQLYTQYYLIQFLIYLIVGVMGISIFISIAPQCKPICPVASENDLALNGYDRKNVMYGMKATADAAPSGYNDVPEEYTYYYSCNMSEALGSPNWWNGTGEAAVRNVWEVAVAQSAKSEFFGSQVYFDWENTSTGLWDNSDENARKITLSNGNTIVVKSKCYVCCDPAYMATNEVCMPSISGSIVYSWCQTPSACASGFMPVTTFPTPPDISLRVLANAQLLILGTFYCIQALMCLSIYCGVSRFQDKYEEDFEGQNMKFWDGLCGFFAKRSPLINRIINTLTIGIICIGIVVSLTNKVCIDAHDQFGRKTYYPTLEFFVICVLVVFCSTCAYGTYFRCVHVPDTVFYLPYKDEGDDTYGKNAQELCFEERRPLACIWKCCRSFVVVWCKFGP